MADSEEQHVSSTTPLFNDEVHHYQAEPEPEPEPEPKQEHFSLDDIVDLVGGAQDALERHMAEDSGPQELTQTSVEEPVTLSEPVVHIPEPEVKEPEPEAKEPEPVIKEAEPGVKEPPLLQQTEPEVKEPEPVIREPEPLVKEPEPEPEPVRAAPDSTSFTFVAPEPSVVPPKAEPESSSLAPEPQAEPAPESDALPAAEPRKAAPAPAEAAERTAVTHHPPAPTSDVPPASKAQPPLLMQFPTEHWDSPFLASQDNSKVSMDPFSKDTTSVGSSKHVPDFHDDQSDDEDDLMYEVKKNNNPFESYSSKAANSYSHFGEAQSDNKASKMSESPTPDLVQYGQTEESQENLSSFLDEGKPFEGSELASDSPMHSMNLFSLGLKDKEEEHSVIPTSLPDILKSSPLNPEKADSGSSEGSPEEQSPLFERKMMESPNPPINLSANNPFAFETKVSLLKEMTEEMEALSTDKEDDEKTFGAFDLVKEAEETSPTKVSEEEPVKIEQKDWFSSHDSPKMMSKFEPLDFQSKKTDIQDSDSESPTADSLSPVLEAMAKNPASFQIETEKEDLKMEMEEPEVAEEVSEHEVSSEEFEFIERPPRGVIDEFLEALDTSKFASSKVPEVPIDDDLSFGQKEAGAAMPLTKTTPPLEAEEEASSESSYHLLTQASPQKSKADLERHNNQQLSTQAPTVSPASKPGDTPAKKSVDGVTLFKMPNLNIRAVVDLLYWRDVKNTGVVFGAALLLLLSLTMCSIVSVCSYIGLALLSVTICFRIYKGILQAIQKSDEGHPFKQYLDQEVALSEEMVHKYSDVALSKLNKTIGELRRVFLVEDLVDSIKFAVLMWILTYVGAFFNGLTLIILGLIAAFTCPIVYEKHQAQIDHYVALVNNQVKDVVGKIQAKVPGMKRKAE
ncbi:reticulon-4 isoform X2 [Oryzias latipes]|uniref:reticulon-4 isoform X2 n=1 Tax=Oryzias latipes TaxID=8090 RepID=UPI0009D93A6B|nr:reticulon-4 isoform X2 [Oryzias latipes]